MGVYKFWTYFKVKDLFLQNKNKRIFRHFEENISKYNYEFRQKTSFCVIAFESGNKTTRTRSLEVLLSLTIALKSYLFFEISKCFALHRSSMKFNHDILTLCFGIYLCSQVCKCVAVACYYLLWKKPLIVFRVSQVTLQQWNVCSLMAVKNWFVRAHSLVLWKSGIWRLQKVSFVNAFWFSKIGFLKTYSCLYLLFMKLWWHPTNGNRLKKLYLQ